MTLIAKIQSPVYFPREQSSAVSTPPLPPNPGICPHNMWGGTERGGVNSPSWADQQQQPPLQQQQQPPLQQQQHQQPWGPSPCAMHALELYRACVAAGHQARFTLEQRPEGEYFTLSSRPPPHAATATSVAAAGGRRNSRKPNQKRAEKLRARRESRRSKTAARLQQQPQGKGSASDLQQHQQQQATASSRSMTLTTVTAADRGPQQQTVQPATTSAALAAAGTPAMTELAQQKQQHGLQQQHPSTRETRASKRRKTWSSPSKDTTISHCNKLPVPPPSHDPILQVDGADSGPDIPNQSPAQPFADPPPPPPMSEFFPKNPYKVLCQLCWKNSHFTYYDQCEFCHCHIKYARK